MDRNTDNRLATATLHENAARAFDSLDQIERATSDGCSAQVLQDIVGNLLVLLAWLDDENGARRFAARATDQRVRTLLVDCLERAGVPAHAIPGSLGVIRDCFGKDGLAAEEEIDRALSGPAAAD